MDTALFLFFSLVSLYYIYVTMLGMRFTIAMEASLSIIYIRCWRDLQKGSRRCSLAILYIDDTDGRDGIR